jgi:chromosomal replication initiator protein
MSNQDKDDVRLLKSTKDIWAEARDILEKTLSQPAFHTFIRPTTLVSILHDEATLAVCNDFMRGKIYNDHLDAITSALRKVTKQDISVKIVIDPGAASSEPYLPTIANISIVPDDRRDNESSIRYGAKSGSYNGGGTQRANLSQKYTFNTFVVGSHNRFCHSAALAVAERPGQSYNPLFVYGGVGLGKTHIMQAIGHEVLRLQPNLAVRYISCERFTNELINSIRDDRMGEFRKRYRQVDVLLMDDIQFIQGKESTQEEFFHTFNALRDGNRQIVLSSDRPPKAISLLEERLRSRFEWGLITDIQAPDLETRVAILRKKSELEGLHVPDEIIQYIATVFTSNIRELEGALIRSHAYAKMTGTDLTVSALSEIILPTVPKSPKANLTLDSIIEAVSHHYRIESSEVRSTRRSQDLTLPRHIAMYLAHELIQLSFPRIGQGFANRKHTSALYGHGRIKVMMLQNPDVAASVKAISRQLTD